MEEFTFLIILVAFLLTVFFLRYVRKILDKNRKSYDDSNYNSDEYNIDGYNKYGYNIEGKNKNGRYNRIFDAYSFNTSQCNRDGFYNPRYFPVRVTNHAMKRMTERMSVHNETEAEKLAYEAYCYGKSKRQVKKSSVLLIEEIENRYEKGILLVYCGYIYIFSVDNKLITVYKNDRIQV